MKKLLVIVIAGTLLLTGCGKTDKEKRESKYGKENNSITEKLSGMEEFSGLMILNDATLASQIGLTLDDVENYLGALPYTLDSKFYVAIKPKKGSEDLVKQALDIYTTVLLSKLENSLENTSDEEKSNLQTQIDMINNHMEKEINGYYVYISSSDNDSVLKIIKENLKK